jgi:thymidylate synthase (FAD)
MAAKVKVTLLACTPSPEKVVACGAKLCYSSAGVDELYSNLTPEKTTDFIEMLADLGHESPMEHTSFTFGIEGVSRALLAQLTRHRIASYSVKSQRYVEEGQFSYIIPPEIEKNAEAKELFIKTMEENQAAYDRLTDLLKRQHLIVFIDAGMDEKKAKRAAEKAAIEDARFVLPNACETKIVMSINARSLINFFHKRCCQRAQWEIRELSEQMLALVKEQAPVLFKKAGPPCVSGPCPEGKMSCGKMSQMRKKYLNG